MSKSQVRVEISPETRQYRGILSRHQFGAQWKTQIGHTIWDNDCGTLLDLEDTWGWHLATVHTRKMQEALDVQARRELP